MRQLNILVTPHGEVLAHTTRALMIAEELRSRGANVAFAMRGDKTAIVEAAGFPVHDIVGVPLHSVLRRLREGNPKLSSSGQAAECVTADIDILKRERPDIVLSDFRPSMWSASSLPTSIRLRRAARFGWRLILSCPLEARWRAAI